MSYLLQYDIIKEIFDTYPYPYCSNIIKKQLVYLSTQFTIILIKAAGTCLYPILIDVIRKTALNLQECITECYD